MLLNFWSNYPFPGTTVSWNFLSVLVELCLTRLQNFLRQFEVSLTRSLAFLTFPRQLARAATFRILLTKHAYRVSSRTAWDYSAMWFNMFWTGGAGPLSRPWNYMFRILWTKCLKIWILDYSYVQTSIRALTMLVWLFACKVPEATNKASLTTAV